MKAADSHTPAIGWLSRKECVIFVSRAHGRASIRVPDGLWTNDEIRTSSGAYGGHQELPDSPLREIILPRADGHSGLLRGLPIGAW